MYYLLIILIFLFVIYIYKLKKEGFVCLMYHNVYKVGVEGIVSTEEFEKHMQFIKNKKTFKMEDLKSLNYKLPKNSILVTFDDGYKNNYTEAFPILKKYGIKATIFINTKYIGNDEDYLSWENIKEMYDSGLVDFQLHTHSHDLTIRKCEVIGFYDDNTFFYFKKESCRLFFEDVCDDRENFIKLNGLPIFKLVSQISRPGHKIKNNFIENYKKIINEDNFFLNDEEKKIYLNKLFKKRKNEFFTKIGSEEYKEVVKYEILENKRIIREKLGKNADVLAYPWGHRYKGNKKFLKKLGVDIFVTTKKRKNNFKLNKNFIYRINGDKLEINTLKKF